MRTLFCVSTLLSVIASSSPAFASDVTGNAALVYWQAFEGLKDISGEDYQRAMRTAIDKPLDEEFVELISASRHSLKLMHRASRRTYCDWGVDLREDGAEAILPYLALSRGLARIALLRARHNFFLEKHRDGVDDVLAVMTMARHAGRDRSLVGLLVNHAIERMAHEVAAAHLPALPEAELSRLESGLSRLPAQNSFAECMATEAEFVTWLRRRVAATTHDEELTALATVLGLNPQDGFFEENSREQIVAQTRELAAVYRRLPGIVSRPDSLQHDPFQASVDEAKRIPLGRLFFPALDKAWHSHRRYICYDAMMRAGLGVVQRGEQTLHQYIDPTDGEAFELLELDDGFALRSHLEIQPGSEDRVRLTFGRTEIEAKNQSPTRG